MSQLLNSLFIKANGTLTLNDIALLPVLNTHPCAGPRMIPDGHNGRGLKGNPVGRKSSHCLGSACVNNRVNEAHRS